MKSVWVNRIKVKDVVSPIFKQVPYDYNARALMDELLDSPFGEAVITDDEGRLCGFITIKKLLCYYKDQLLGANTRIEEIMIRDPIKTFLHEEIDAARQKMRDNRIGRLPVVDEDDVPYGILTALQVCNQYSARLEDVGRELETVFNTIEEAIILVDENLTVNYWNAGAEKIYGIKREEILGKNLKDFFPDTIILETFKTKQPVYNDYKITDNGKHLLKASIPVFNGNRIKGVVCTTQEVTKFINLISELNQVRERVSCLEKKSGYEDEKIKLLYRSRSESFRKVLETARILANTDTTVLLLGESGTGKELVASAIHSMSNRREKPFVVINCAAIPETLFESEFFGYAKGAFTGATKDGMPGKFELANGGTLFLDEIGELSLDMQAKLLRVLQEKSFYRVGGITPISTDVRIIAATNKDLLKMVKEGTFREDLYYRLNVFNIKLPPLRRRREDIPGLIEVFLDQFTKKYNLPAPVITDEALEVFSKHDWPGNIRELRNFMERIVVFKHGQVVTRSEAMKMINGDSWEDETEENRALVVDNNAPEKHDLDEILEEKERQIIIELLQKCKYNKSEVARILNIPRSTLYYRMKTLNIS